ncbi:hypothetical protein EDC01DRAFT_632751 [Geopyxis carbonaria]|nr:hypothetical protein EDC01DRAFT_632751 [Geopyxis carbonaria]
MTSQMVDIHTPGLKWWLNHLETSFHAEHSVDLFVNVLKRRSVRNPTPAALATAQLFLRLMSTRKVNNIPNLVEYMLSLETKLSAARPRELSIRNMVRRVLAIIREEAENIGLGEQFKAAMEAAEAAEAETADEARAMPPARNASRPPLVTSHTSFAVGTAQVTSLFNVISHPATPQTISAASSPPQSGYQTPVHAPLVTSISHPKDIRPAIIQDIQELIEELESSEVAISEYGPQLIHKNEVIMTYGFPSSVYRLLLRAAHKRDHDFTVVVVEGSPNILNHTHGVFMNKIPLLDEDDETTQRKSLQELGIQVILIADTNIYNFIGRVNKVILGANYVLADGSVLATSGALNVARAAKTLDKPVVVVAGSHALCPITAFNRFDLIEMGPPMTVGFEQAGDLLDKVDFPNPLADFIEPQFVTMFVTNKYAPKYIVPYQSSANSISTQWYNLKICHKPRYTRSLPYARSRFDLGDKTTSGALWEKMKK